MERSKVIEEYNELIDGHSLFSGCITMGLIEKIFQNDEYNVFDRDYLMRQLILEWTARHGDILIPPNPQNAKYVVISIDHPDYHHFTDSKEQAIVLRNANMRAGYATRIVDTTTAKIVVD